MRWSKLILVSFLIGISFDESLCSIEGIVRKHSSNKLEKLSKVALCGGAIDADSESIIFPGPSETLSPGDICVWTVHLETTRDFRFNFSNLDVNSRYTDCRDGGVRIYALTNLVPAGDSESYTYCNQKPAVGTFYLGYNVAAIVLYVGSDNTNPGSGFTLNWVGNAYDPMRTKHASSFSNALEGIIRYPVTGHYSPNVAATWLIKSITAQETTRSDVTLSNINMESCNNPQDRCTCDALIFYEISPDGHLNETRRFCGESSGAFLHNIESRFLLAFFTDFEAEPNGGGGFEIVYYPSEIVSTSTTFRTTTYEYTTEETTTEETTTEEATTEETTTEETTTEEATTEETTTEETTTEEATTEETTTEEATTEEATTEERTTEEPTTTEEWETTTPEGPIVSTKCGDVLEGTEGIISYKAGEQFSPNERCVWTIRTPNIYITFNLLNSGFGTDTDDKVNVCTIDKFGDVVECRFFRTQDGPVRLNGSIAIASFISDATIEGQGFILSYSSSGSFHAISPSSRDFIVNGTKYLWTPGNVSHPTQGYYSNNEVSTFLISFGDFKKLEANSPTIVSTFEKISIENCCSCDLIKIYEFDLNRGWEYNTSYCDETSNGIQRYHSDMVLFVFVTDSSQYGQGFNLSWEYMFNKI